MIKFEHTEVLGWEAAIRGMRNPMNCEYGLPHEEAIVYILSELEVRLKEA